jgi:uncharacterized membrane protein YkvA (DUF1232 family)
LSAKTDRARERGDRHHTLPAIDVQQPARPPLMFDALKQWARAIKRDIVALWLAARDPRVPWYAKAVAGVVAAYALSPIDLIPDFIPVLGYLDDMIIVPLGILLAVYLIPAEIMSELRTEAATRSKPRAWAGLVLILAIWIAATLMAIRWWF